MKLLFKKYMNSACTPEEFEKVAEFLSDKKNEFDATKLIKAEWEQLLNKDFKAASNPAIKDRLLTAVRLEKGLLAQKRLKLYTWALRIAAVLIIGFVVSTVFILTGSDKNKIAGQVQTIKTPYGAKTSIGLPDGSLVWLNSGSVLSYPSKFEENRPVTLIGEAFFDIEKSSKPFIVSTNYGDVEVKGTSFNVKAYSDDNSFETTLVEGIVALRNKSAENEVTLRPGQQAVLTANGFDVEKVQTDLFTSWKEGKLIFREEYLPVVARKLERWYNVKIELSEDKRLTEISYTGTIEMESFSEVLQLLKVTASIDYTYDEKSRIIKIFYKN